MRNKGRFWDGGRGEERILLKEREREERQSQRTNRRRSGRAEVGGLGMSSKSVMSAA